MQIFGYPEMLFPPTDFHTATVVGDHVYVIGSLGYPHTRRFGETPVFRLDLRDFHIEPVVARGDEPGWISRHRARLDQGRILVSDGELSDLQDGEERYCSFAGTYALDLVSLLWSRVPNPTVTQRPRIDSGARKGGKRPRQRLRLGIDGWGLQAPCSKGKEM